MLSVCKKMFLKSFPDSHSLDFTLEKEKKVRILWLLAQVALELGVVCHSPDNVLVNGKPRSLIRCFSIVRFLDLFWSSPKCMQS